MRYFWLLLIALNAAFSIDHIEHQRYLWLTLSIFNIILCVDILRLRKY